MCIILSAHHRIQSKRKKIQTIYKRAQHIWNNCSSLHDMKSKSLKWQVTKKLESTEAYYVTFPIFWKGDAEVNRDWILKIKFWSSNFDRLNMYFYEKKSLVSDKGIYKKTMHSLNTIYTFWHDLTFSACVASLSSQWNTGIDVNRLNFIFFKLSQSNL